jgi:hypothetical protein
MAQQFVGNERMVRKYASYIVCATLLCVLGVVLMSCDGAVSTDSPLHSDTSFDNTTLSDSQSAAPETNDPAEQEAETITSPEAESEPESVPPPEPDPEKENGADAGALRAALNLAEDYRPSFVHGEKPAQFQKYIMIHDTEGTSDPQSVINWWDSNGNLVAAHFIVGTDGSVAQCVPLDAIAHHAGFGNAGHNASFGVEDESRDDKKGTVAIGSWAPDYGMNSYSIGIELVHVGGSGSYPQAQLNALDKLIAYIDAYYGFKSTITDHKAWRSGNSDTSPEFASYLANYQATRTHNGA